MVGNVVSLNLSIPAARKIIKNLSEQTENVFIIDHAKNSMRKRHITNDQIFDCLRKGQIIEGPYRDINTGNWRMKVEHVSAGQIVRVVAEILVKEDGEKIIIITVF